MIRSWKPQVRSFIFNRLPFWVFLGILALSFSAYFLATDLQISALILGLYTIGAIYEYFYVKRWKVEGYEKITLDTNRKILIFDNKFEIPFSDIRSINYRIENNPNKSIFTRHDILDNGRIDYIKLYSFLEINSVQNPYISFAIQNKIMANQIITCLNKCGFNIPKTDKRTLNIALILRIIGIIIAAIILLYILQHGKI